MATRSDVITALRATAELYGKTLSKVAATMLVSDLGRFTPDQVVAALGKCRLEMRTFPSVSDIAARVDDGRPGVEEAWAMIPKHESESIVWTEEMAEAFGSARVLLDEGDAIGARMAFKEVYGRLVAAARNGGRPPVWTPSLGHDPGSRQAALRDAVERGRLAIEQATALTPEQLGAGGRATTGIEGLSEVVKRLGYRREDGPNE